MVFMVPLLVAQTIVPLEATSVTVASYRAVAESNTGELKGNPWRLSWSPDGTQLYLAARNDRSLPAVVSHWIVDAKSGAISPAPAEPAWAGRYWEWKSRQSAPGTPALKIVVDTQGRNESATSRPTGGALARGGTEGAATGDSIDDVASSMSQNVVTTSLLLLGEVIGRAENQPMIPGLTFGWAPRGANAIAFVNRQGRVVVMDDRGRKLELERSKNVLLPAWSEDATTLAWVERNKKGFRIVSAALTNR